MRGGITVTPLHVRKLLTSTVRQCSRQVKVLNFQRFYIDSGDTKWRQFGVNQSLRGSQPEGVIAVNRQDT